MINIEIQKSAMIIAFAAISLFSSAAFAQCCSVVYTTINQDGGFGTISSSDFADDRNYEQQRQNRANNSILYEARQMQISRFNQKLLISANAVQSMNATKTQASKYPSVLALYKRSSDTYKKLEPISATAAQNVTLNKDISGFQTQQDKIINEAVEDYHKGQYVQELGDNKSNIINNVVQNLVMGKSLSASEKDDLKKEIDKIKFAQAQIAKLNNNIDPLKKSQVDLERKQAYQTIAQSIVFLSKIVEKAILAINPNKNANEAITLTETMVQKYMDENIENGKPPTIAISESFQKGYDKFKQDELLKAVTPIKELSKVPLLVESLAKEIEKWNKIEKNQRETLNKISEIIKFTDDGIKRNQAIIDRSTANSKAIVNKAIDRYLNKPLK